MALRRADQYRGPQKLRSWLFGIVHRTAVDALARERKQRRPVLLADPPDARREPMVADERRQILDEAIARLPVAERAVLLMRMQLELPFADIASLLDIPLNTALGRMHNALRRLRDNENLRQYFTEDLPAG